ncbi:MAG: phosphoenolpyruvate--protein phosphotransferase [Candidatus Berkiella sp.]
MLNVLRQIVQEVNEAQDLQEVLHLMVKRVSESISVEACSVYLADRRHNHFLLAASVGFLEGVNGKITIGFSEGLVGLVGEREEPINLSHANQHPRYRYYPETGEEKYQAFLGVPIIHQRRLVGILVIQQREPRRFDEGEVAFLVTISAQLAGIIAHGQIAGMVDELSNFDNQIHTTIRGVPAASGVGIGEVVVVYKQADLDTVPDRVIEDVPHEIMQFEKALADTRTDIERLKLRLEKMLLPEEQNLFDAYLSILDSKSLKADIIELIEEKHWAPYALRKIIKRQVHKFEAMEDLYLRERATDLIDLGQRVLANLQSETTTSQTYPQQTILVGDEVTASMLAEVPQESIVGVVSAKGSANSHVAILARAMGIPAVMGASGLPVYKLEGKCIIVDGYNGEVFTSPSQSMQIEFLRLAEEEKELYAGLSELRELRAETPDGVRIPLCANAGLVADIRPALQAGAEGVGLYRTEVPFMIRDRFPGEEEQYLIYRQLLESFAPKQVTIRTLDVGGDKMLPYFPIEEDNPYLGWRGIRVTLDHPEIFLVQLRAMLRASSGLNNLRVMFPMISSIQEVEEALRLLRQAHREVIDEGSPVLFPQTGVMIEVPSAVYQARSLMTKVDFASIGSNDLTQYLLAVDRNNPYVASMFDSLHPAVIGAIKAVIDAAHLQNKKVSLCGEMAGDPAAVVILLGLGIDMLSMNAHSLPRVKWIIRNFTVARAKQLFEEVKDLDHARDVRQHLEKALEDAGLGGLIRAGK